MLFDGCTKYLERLATLNKSQYVEIYILEAYAIPPTPLEAAHDFQGIRFQNSVLKAFQRQVRHVNSLSEASSGFLSRL